MFMIGTDEWDPSYEKKYDEIVENAVLVPGIWELYSKQEIEMLDTIQRKPRKQ